MSKLTEKDKKIIKKLEKANSCNFDKLNKEGLKADIVFRETDNFRYYKIWQNKKAKEYNKGLKSDYGKVMGHFFFDLHKRKKASYLKDYPEYVLVCGKMGSASNIVLEEATKNELEKERLLRDLWDAYPKSSGGNLDDYDGKIFREYSDLKERGTLEDVKKVCEIRKCRRRR